MVSQELCPQKFYPEFYVTWLDYVRVPYNCRISVIFLRPSGLVATFYMSRGIKRSNLPIDKAEAEAETDTFFYYLSLFQSYKTILITLLSLCCLSHIIPATIVHWNRALSTLDPNKRTPTNPIISRLACHLSPKIPNEIAKNLSAILWVTQHFAARFNTMPTSYALASI